MTRGTGINAGAIVFLFHNSRTVSPYPNIYVGRVILLRFVTLVSPGLLPGGMPYRPGIIGIGKGMFAIKRIILSFIQVGNPSGPVSYIRYCLKTQIVFRGLYYEQKCRSEVSFLHLVL